MEFKLYTPALFNKLLERVSKKGEHTFEIGKYTFIFRYASVQIGKIFREKVQIPALDSNIDDNDV
ncbi:MAG: hypothetical protein QXU18_12845, partial [Thermoplasmatales archaeon]